MAAVQQHNNDSIATLQVSLDSLHILVERLESQVRAKTVLPEAHTRTALAELLNFINTHPETSSHRVRAELLVLTAGLFTTSAISEGDSRDCHNIAVEALREIELFRESKVTPLLREFSEAKISALSELKAKFDLEEEVTEQEEMARAALQKNSESIAATSKHLDDVQSSLNNMAYQMEELTERRRGVEEKHREAKERRQAAASAGGGYRVFSLFAPVMAPVAAAASALATATDSELRRLSAQIENLRRHTEGLNPALIEISLKDLNIEHEALQRGVEDACAHCAAVALEKENAQAKVNALEEMQSELDKVCMSLGELQSEVGGKVGEARERAGIAAHLKLACAQAIANMARMSYDEARRWAVGLAGNMLEVVEDVELRELLDTINPIEEDEGIESGGEENHQEECLIRGKPENEYEESEAGPSSIPVPEITVSTPEIVEEEEKQQDTEQLETIVEDVGEDRAEPSHAEDEDEEADHESFVLDRDVNASSSSASSQHTLAHEESGSNADEEQTPVLELDTENVWADDDDEGAPLLVKQDPPRVVDVVPAPEKINVRIETAEITLSLPGAF